MPRRSGTPSTTRPPSCSSTASSSANPCSRSARRSSAPWWPSRRSSVPSPRRPWTASARASTLTRTTVTLLELPSARPRVLLTTEGTYPYASGGVSSWCNLLVNSITELDWQVLPIVAPNRRARLFELPEHAQEIGRIEVWSEDLPRGERPRAFERRGADELPAVLVRNILGWEGDAEAVVDAWVWCRRFPAAVRRAFRSRRGWDAFLDGLRDVLDERISEAGTPPALDLVEATMLYQTLYWVARTASAPTPATDVLHVTAAGWSAGPPARASPGRASRAAWPASPTRARTSSRRSPMPTPTGRWASASIRRRSSCSTTACASLRRPPLRRARRRSCPSVASIRSRTFRRRCASQRRPCARRPTPASCTTGPCPTARSHTTDPARRCTSDSSSATASASWGRRPIPTGSCAPLTSC